ncbi:hypothetical protein QEN58_03675 [Halomonas alkaliantarctica]|uniref:Uncharacterized protein n=1 Tax=Halomonas alkaliantarctica TaxID=232346 RepID=A0ABY8LRG6_9GAMM|nr:hypothetical protein [Halomonas alkaliantarctica]WGI26167.1 hypothetical protein QEN58_03675 [Halomonas alkaliantarctica]
MDNNIEHNPSMLQNQGADWTVEVRRAADFVMSYWALLGIGTLALSVIAMHGYLVGEAIPLSITSPDVINGLPALFILIAYAVFILTCSAALPAMILLSRSKALSRSLLEEMLQSGSSYSNNEHKVRGRLTICWCLGLTVPAIIVISLLYWPESLNWLWYLGVFVTATLSFSFSLALSVRQMLPLVWKAHAKEKWGGFIAYGTFQTLVMINLGAIVESKVSAGLIGILGFLIISMLLLSIFQMAIVWSIWDVSRKPKPIIRAGGIAGIVILVVCTMPPLNQVFVGYAMSSSATGGRGCTVFIWTEESKVLPELRSEDDRLKSVDLRIPMATRDIFYTRPWQNGVSKEIALVPSASVAKVMECDS